MLREKVLEQDCLPWSREQPASECEAVWVQNMSLVLFLQAEPEEAPACLLYETLMYTLLLTFST